MNSGGLIPLQAQPGGIDFAFFMMMGAIFLIFYMLVIRPQQKQQKERDAHLRTATKGDDVVTAGGIHGRVSAVEGEVLEVEIAKLRGGDKVKVKVALNRIEQLTKPGQGESVVSQESSKAKGGAS